ncbi:MAG: MFS transporter [Alphaproteobacteria bacterium]|nr:MFS transporter [Alphaproteobacteria bacterium]
MTAHTWRTPLVVLIAGTMILAISLGIRQTYGLFMNPISSDLGWGRETLSFAVALQALMWGVSTPFAGIIADKYGPGRVLAVGGALYTLGLWLMSRAETPLDASISLGVLSGIAMGCTLFPVVLAVISRVVPERRRSLYLGIASAGGSSGQIFVVPGTQAVLEDHGWVLTMVFLAVMVALIVPMAAALASRPDAGESGPRQSVAAALREALAHRGYVLLFSGYFVCGFQTMFIGTHLPALVQDAGLTLQTGANALAILGLFNIISCYAWGELGGRMRQKYLLVVLYLGRSVLMTVFFLVPISETSVLVFAAALGVFWLGTVPLTGAIVAQIFGVRYMATLFGICFVGHQVGSFLGIWVGGRLFDTTGSYDAVWWTGVALGVFAAVVNWPIDDRPVARLAAARA